MTATRATTVSSVGLPESSHAYSSWRARARALVSGRCTEPLERRGGLEGRLHRLGTFVDSRQRLSLGLRGQHSESDGNAMRQRDVAESPRGFSGDVLEVRRLTADHAAERDDGIVALARGGRFRDDGKLERAGNRNDFDVFVGNSPAPERLPSALEQLGGDFFVKPADDDCHAPLAVGSARGRRGWFVRHDQWVRKWPSLSRFTSR